MIVGAVLIRNEASRYLDRVLANAWSFCDQVVVVDDNSTDDSQGVARARGCLVTAFSGPPEGWWGADEAAARATLWQTATSVAGPGNWLYYFDADQVLEGLIRSDMRALASAYDVNAWAWPLYDCWTETAYRADGYWQGYQQPRVWMVRVPPAGFVPEWPRHGLHVGHFPSNLPLLAGRAPGYIKHLGYLREADRKAKAAKYLACA